jgi:hypothetical protein
MKIALCISGKFRNSIFCFPTIYRNFILNYDTDVFIHTWDDIDDALNLYQPKKILVENEKDVLKLELAKLDLSNEVKVNPYSNINNNILMYYGVKKVIEMVDDSYDFIIRIRPDLYLNTKLHLDTIFDDLNNEKYDLQIPNSRQNHTGMNDQIAIGKIKQMKYYSALIDNVNVISNSIKYWHPETILDVFLKTLGVSVNQLHYEYGIVRNVNVEFSESSNINYKSV